MNILVYINFNFQGLKIHFNIQLLTDLNACSYYYVVIWGKSILKMMLIFLETKGERRFPTRTRGVSVLKITAIGTNVDVEIIQSAT